ncbi:aminoglycoside phosphotransferase family protein [Streptomyces sp. S3(2020)]|uniref:phosphotransferase n=1 Tax=Streptomyces sp. S3(2020) TaxID=2732044 RepID=UPI001488CBA3|nr:phosphotransferase [Streptomyces sp. S3(2020)]NNN34516.1 aminoglycoside phosphotransferase family protein [Streptomyces sp. S3(2020)]
MNPEPVRSVSRQRAYEVTAFGEVVMGPLQGYHHETYVVRLPGGTRRVKVRELRDGILWFDRRCFRSEEQLLRGLQGWITYIPDVFDVDGMHMQGFIEGRTLGRSLLWSRRVPGPLFVQLVQLFEQMVHITPDKLWVERRCALDDRAVDGDTDRFLGTLIDFMEQRVYYANLERFGSLFQQLGLGSESIMFLRKSVAGLRARPFCLLHGDLHRENLVIDPGGNLWTIDWELALLGDPLYDLATHLYLMRYPADQERAMVREWCRVVELVRPGSSYGWEEDLPRILAFKKAQSVFTDVIRTSLSLGAGSKFDWSMLPGAVRRLRDILAAAAEPLGLEMVPTPAQIMAALVRWQRTTHLEFA